ncbi:MAG: Qat anti-phage system TatD family nuclease QatD [Candidatus Sulfotelmatobacter sp.]|jgi:TatD DNase family protein
MIDFHCHLELFPDPPRVVAECVRQGLYVLSVTTTPSAWAGSAALVADAKRIRVALGLHPQLARERRLELPLFDRLLAETRYVGEIGLDGTPELRTYWMDQTYVFDHILSACQAAGGKIMTVHSRRAVTDVLDCLEAHQGAGVPVLHWYSGSQRELARAVGMGCWFSVGPAMLVGEKGRKLVAKMPQDRVLTETDGPFAALNGQSVFPWDVAKAVVALADLWAIDRGHVETLLQDNLRRLTTST